jgi:predicted DNA-binding transcriptional regulator AlpA
VEYTFALKYQLPRHDEDMDALVERLAEAGCDDALVGIGQPGWLALEFTREAASARIAVRSALADVKQAVPTAILVEARPDLVGLTDIAEILGISRQAVRKMMLSHVGGFPPPMHEGAASIWHLADVLTWLEGRGYSLDSSLQEVAGATLEVNLAKEMHRHPSQEARELEPIVA